MMTDQPMIHGGTARKIAQMIHVVAQT